MPGTTDSPEPFGEDDVAGVFEDCAQLQPGGLPDFQAQAEAYEKARRKSGRNAGLQDECGTSTCSEKPATGLPDRLEGISAADFLSTWVRIANRKTDPSRLNMMQSAAACLHTIRHPAFANDSATSLQLFVNCDPKRFTAMVHEWARVLRVPVPNGRSAEARKHISTGAWHKHNARRMLKEAA